MDVKLIDVMGDDLRVVNAARVSFSKESNKLDEKDQKLLKYLAKHNHWTPFSHVQITMREKVPIFVARQRFKHMVGFTYNEVSRRYVDDPPEFFNPKEWRKKSENKKQGSSSELINQVRYWDPIVGPDEHWVDIEEFVHRHHHDCLWVYQSLINEGVAPEQARMVLPQSMYTEYYVTGSLAAWARAYLLRIDPHAQKEIQDLASQWNKNISSIDTLKYSWSALIGKET